MISDRALLRVVRAPSAVALWGDLIRALIAGAIVFVCAVLLLYYAQLAKTMATELHMNDFGKFYYAARLFLNGDDMYAPTPATDIPVSRSESRQFLNLNPPHFHLLILPLAALPPVQALMVWAFGNLVAFGVCAWLITRELALAWTPTRLLWAALGVLACSATGMIVATGQLTFILMLPITLAWIAARREDGRRAAIWMGIAASVKPFLGIFLIYFAAARAARAVTWMIVAGLACGAGGVAVFGVEAYRAWLRSMTGVEWAWAPMNGSIFGLLSRGFAESPFFTHVAVAPRMVAIGGTIAALAIGIAAVSACVRDRSAEASDRTFATLLVTALLASPLGWAYYLWWVAGPAIALVIAWPRRHSALRDALALLAIPGLVMPVVLVFAGGRAAWTGLTIGSIYSWTTLFLWGSLMADWRVRGLPSDAKGPPGRSRA